MHGDITHKLNGMVDAVRNIKRYDNSPLRPGVLHIMTKGIDKRPKVSPVWSLRACRRGRIWSMHNNQRQLCCYWLFFVILTSIGEASQHVLIDIPPHSPA